MGNALPRTLDLKLNDTDSYLYQQVTQSAIHLEALRLAELTTPSTSPTRLYTAHQNTKAQH
jgi:hypothetical protein